MNFLHADTIVGHLMQVVHLNPVFELQLLQMFPDGLEDLEEQVAAMVSRTHPRTRTIGAVIEDPDYHRRLRDYICRYREDPDTPALVRGEQTLRFDPGFARIEQTMDSLPGSCRTVAACRGSREDFSPMFDGVDPAHSNNARRVIRRKIDPYAG